MNPLLLYACLLAIMFQALFASTLPNREDETLKGIESGCSKTKSVRKGAPKAKESLVTPLKKKRTDKQDKSSGMVKEDKPASLSELLPKVLVEIVIGYLSDAYPILVSTHSWLLQENDPRVAVDSARVYVMTKSEGLMGLNHSAANLKEEERCCTEFGDPQGSNYSKFRSSHDGRYVFFNCSYKKLTDRREPTEHSTKWLAQDSEFKDRRFKNVAFDEEGFFHGLLSRDGQTLFCHGKRAKVARVCRINEEAGKDPAAFMKFRLNGMVRAVSGNGNRVMMARREQLEIHDIDKDADKLVCQINVDVYFNTCALNEDGSEAAFVKDDVIRIVNVDKVTGDSVDQPAIVSVKAPKPTRWIKLVYSDENKLHVLHKGGKISLLDPSTNEFIPIETPQEGQKIIASATSPNANYTATILCVREEKSSGKRLYKTTVRRKFTKTDWVNIFGYKADSHKADK